MSALRGNRVLFSALLLATVFFVFAEAGRVSAATMAEIDARIAAEERRRKELDKKLEDYKSSIQRMNRRAEGLLDRIDDFKQKASVTQQEISILELQISKLQKSISSLNEEMTKIQNKIDVLVVELKLRMVDLYKYGASEELQLIFSAHSTQEVLNFLYLMDRLAQYDRYLLEQLRNTKQEIELSRLTVQDHRERLQKQAQALTGERQKYNTTISQTNSLLNDIRRQKALAEKTAREMEEAQKAAGETILTLMRQKKEREEAARRAGTGRGSVDYLVGRGRGNMFDWPIRGKISSPFGSRIHPVFKTRSFHSGLDIAAPRGTPIGAGAPGEVLYVGWMRGYGQVVIIDHGRNYSTVYAHMSSSRVKTGEIVRAGTIVGTVGNTGTATGYHLHFEVRVGSSAKNPLDYLKR
ncbi:MAG: peptidoglycan DD-metalloendopeptidase family protein [Synergistaceae bacterium]|jgi:murein DD-endopeptidase MepM/ murein hydrolase activator NlpD|nr:peptidoglycan DD-metalloendopeptidase family protein [Synergistaceae bacterium]